MTILKLINKVGDRSKGASNLKEDLIAVQQALSIIAELSKNKSFDPRGNEISNNPTEASTLAAILAFQKTFMSIPDGVVSPGLLTHKKINKTIKELQCASLKATSPTYFVIHSTAGKLSKEIILGYARKNFHGKAHAYIMDDGEIVNVQKFSNRGVYATKVEKATCKLVGSMLHIELNYSAGGKPSTKQYEVLAGLYVKLVDEFKKKLIIVTHKEVDRGIKAGHSDPENFSFTEVLCAN